MNIILIINYSTAKYNELYSFFLNFAFDINSLDMTKKSRNILLITSAVLIIGVGTYFFLKRRNRTKITDKTEKIAGKTVKEWDDLKKNLPDYLPEPEVNSSEPRTTSEGDKLAGKIFPYYYFGIIDLNDPKKAERVSVYYYEDGDFRLYHTPYDYTTKKKGKGQWVASGRWIGKNGTKVKIEPKESEFTEKYQIEKGTYEGIDVKNMLSKIFGANIGYYNADDKLFRI